MSHIPAAAEFDTLTSTPLPIGDEAVIPAAWLLGATGAGLLLLIALMHRAGLAIDPLAPSTLAFATAFVGIAALHHLFRDARTAQRRALRDLAFYYGMFMLIGLVGAVASYPLSAASRGYVDEGLLYTDQLLRFDWLAWYETVAAHRSLQILGTIAYQSIFVSPAILLAWFAHFDERAAAHRFLATIIGAAALVLALFSVMPAEGPLATLWHGPLPYVPDSGRWMAELIPPLRAHSLHVVDLGALRGLVSAPSFHTASAVLYIAAAWPYARLRWPLTALNVAMLLATPVEGTHYLTDMILGAGVAMVALGSVALLADRAARRGGAAQTGSTAIRVTP